MSWKKWFIQEDDVAKPEQETAPAQSLGLFTPPTPSTNGNVPRAEPAPEPAPDSSPAPFREDGTLDFAAIYRRSNIPERPFGAEFVLELLDSVSKVPTGREVKRDMIMTNLRHNRKNGASPEAVTADAEEKVVALTTFGNGLQERTTNYVSELQAEVEDLRKQIELRTQKIEQAEARLDQARSQCRAELKRLEAVMELLAADSAPPQ